MALEDILSYSIYSFAQQSWNHTGENDFWMVDIEVLLLIPFSFNSFLFRHLQDGTLDGKILDSFFPHPLFPSKFFKNLQKETLDGKILGSSFSHPSFLSKFLVKQTQEWTLDG